ncbi:bifunctional adenosylcobinamide kinase/adenosylcobinamide-phosphate guanylyltransferase, partial [Escherichia coli]|uniref:bifunctional adenosylcobinamide kinase/adenosylcobinamide-phosphate guanylyltransferase n=1 Tax=Escherichia coli TaxID=562 RepID=UPI0025A2CDED
EVLIGDSSQVLYIATSQILDDEMAARIEHHRQSRPEHWRTVEQEAVAVAIVRSAKECLLHRWWRLPLENDIIKDGRIVDVQRLA